MGVLLSRDVVCGTAPVTLQEPTQPAVVRTAALTSQRTVIVIAEGDCDGWSPGRATGATWRGPWVRGSAEGARVAIRTSFAAGLRYTIRIC
jgi:hypothetical protein